MAANSLTQVSKKNNPAMSTSIYRNRIRVTEARGSTKGYLSPESRPLHPSHDAMDLTVSLSKDSRNASPRHMTGPWISERSRALYSRGEDRTAVSESPCDIFVVGQNDEDLPRVSFFPYDGKGAGVAMGLAFYQEGMVMKQTSILHCLPPFLRDTDSLPFTVRWPGYAHISATRDITLIDPQTGSHVSYGRLAQQISQMFATFIERFGDDFDGTRAGIKLGPKAVTFHNLRLLQAYVQDDSSLDVEVSYTRRH